MDRWLWLIYFLPVSGALRIVPEVKLKGMLGGSITIECPLPEMSGRVYLCREITESQACFTVVSSQNFVRKEYRHRVTLKLYPDLSLFLVEVAELTESDSGVYACGAGLNTDRGKTQKVTLDVHSGSGLLAEPTSEFLLHPEEYGPFWEEEPMIGPPGLFQRFLPRPMPPWFQDPAFASPFEFIPKVITPAPRTEAPPVHHPTPTPPAHRPQVSISSSVVAAKATTLLPSTTGSKTSASERLLRPQTASYNHHTRLHRQRAHHHSSGSRMEEQGFSILIPASLALILLAFLVLLVKRVIQRRKALSRRVNRLAVRMSALEASQRPQAQRPRASQRPRSQNNVYSACPRRDRRAHAAGDPEAPVPGPGESAPPAPPQVSEAPWPHVPSLKTSCEYLSFYHQPAAKLEDADSDDYVNISCLAPPSSCPPGPRPLCQ